MSETPDVELVFLELAAKSAAEAKERVEQALLELAYREWKVETVLDQMTAEQRFGVEVGAPSGTTRRDGWDVAHALGAQLNAEAEAVLLGEQDVAEVLQGLEAPVAAPAPDWHLKEVNALALTATGVGVRIGHPDTGATSHAELGNRVLVALGRNFLEPGQQPIDPLHAPGQPGHGTATASLMVSPTGSQVQGQPPLSGLAPDAEVVPIRVTNSVVVLAWQARLARAIEHAVDQGCHVISLSLGGLPGARLRWAIRYARMQGVIVVAAAGNYFPFVVWPAAYPEVIGAAASGPGKRVWSGSARGPAVDITAPGADVYVARWSGPTQSVGTGSGTSFSAALVAGAAALWLSKHGVAALKARYPGSALGDAFAHVLRASASPHLDTGLAPKSWYGGGLLDCAKLLDAVLPDVASLHEAVGRVPSGDELETLLESLTSQGAAEAIPADHSGLLHRIRAAPASDPLAIELIQNLVLDTEFREASRSVLEGTAGSMHVPTQASALLRSVLTRARTNRDSLPNPPKAGAKAGATAQPAAAGTASTGATARVAFSVPIDIQVRIGVPRQPGR